jgi:UDP-N-acetylglucosamine enolpyruvyl transferase
MVLESEVLESEQTVLAGLVARGETVIDRGYEKIEAQLARVGAQIRRVE